MGSLFHTLFGAARPLIGMVHLAPLPGSPRAQCTMDELVSRAVADARTLAEAGYAGVMVENYGDIPFFGNSVPPETLAAITVCVREVVGAVSLPVGVNLLRNDAVGALAVAHAAGARFIRINVHTGVMITDQGLLTGNAAETTRLRARLGADVALFADVWVKHAEPFPGAELSQAAEDTFHRGLADALVVTGSGTGKTTDLARVAAVRSAVPEAPVLVGSGVTPATVSEVLAAAHGAIVGSSIARNGTAGTGVDPIRARALVQAVAAAS